MNFRNDHVSRECTYSVMVWAIAHPSSSKPYPCSKNLINKADMVAAGKLWFRELKKLQVEAFLYYSLLSPNDK